MAVTMNNSGRIQMQPSPSGDLGAVIDQALIGVLGGGGPGPGLTGKPIYIKVGDDREVPLHIDPEGGIHGTRTVRGTRQFSTIDEAVNSFYMMSDEYRQHVMERLYYYGLTDGPNNEAQAAAAWGKAVEMAWNYGQAGKEVDPMDMLPRMTSLKAGQLGNEPRTTTQRSFNMLDPAEAQAFIRQSFQAAMGRDPHDAEIRNLMRGLEAGFQENPAVTQQTVDGDGNSTQRVLDPGFDQQAFIANQLDADPEARAYQAAAELFPALQQALGSPI